MPKIRFRGDTINFPFNMSMDDIEDVLGGMNAAIQATVEFGATLATGAGAEVIGGLTALATGDADAVEGMMSRLTYQPRTEAGRKAMARIAKDIKHFTEETGLDHMSGYWRDRVVPALQEAAGPEAGSVLGAVGLAAMVGIMEVTPGGRVVKGAAKRRIWEQTSVNEPKRDFIIMSAERPDMDNVARTETLGTHLNEQYPDRVHEVDGYYDGDEKAFLIDDVTPAEKKSMAKLAQSLEQDSILHRGGMEMVNDVYKDGKQVDKAGTFHPLKSRKPELFKKTPDNYYSSMMVQGGDGKPRKVDFSFDIDWDTTYDVPNDLTKHVKPMAGIHFGKKGLETIDPEFAGTGSAGAETLRDQTVPKSYFYTGEQDLRKESMVLGERYESVGENIYDLQADPAHLKEYSGFNPDVLEQTMQQGGAGGYWSDRLKNAKGKRTGGFASFDALPVMTREQMEGIGPRPAAGRGNREEFRAMGGDFLTRDNKSPIITPSDIQGKPMFGIMGDQVRTGVTLDNINGVPLDHTIQLMGGPEYGTMGDAAWASMPGAAGGLQNRINKLAEMGQGNPVASYMSMSPTAANFSYAPEIMVSQVKALNLSQAKINAFNKEIRKTHKDFAGIDDPMVYDQMKGESGVLRKSVVQEMSKKKWEKQGFPVYEDTIRAISEKSLIDAPVGTSKTMFEGIPGTDIILPGKHNVYAADILGKYLGGFESPVPAEVMFPKLFKEISQEMTKGKAGARPFTRSEIVKAIQIRHDAFEPTTQKWVDSVSKYLEKQKGTSLAAVLGAWLATGDKEKDEAV